ncbi:hypothetical protein ACFOEZ_00715 [Tianweitania populi]|nr:hypothetical protein [Tianweitania populi]
MNAAAYLKNSIAENLVRRTPGIYQRFQHLAQRSETMSLDERRALRDALTLRTLAKARKTRHGKMLESPGSFSDWPILEKEMLRQDPDLCSVRTLLPAHAASTGGTTGIPIKLRRSLSSVVFEQAILDHLVHRFSGLDLKTARVAVLRGDAFKDPGDTKPPFWQEKTGNFRLVASSFHLNGSTISAFIAAFRKFQPDLLWVYPSSLEAFVRLGDDGLKDHPIKSLKLVLSSSEVLSADVSREATEKLNVPVLDFYGQSERVSASYSVAGNEHYFLPAYGRVELLPVEDSDASGLYEIIGTSYWNAAQPLVRFRTGDLARLPGGMSVEEIEAVTLGILPFLGVEGRQSEYVLSPEGSRLIGMNHIPRGVPDIAQMQIIQTEAARVEIQVVPLPSFGEESRKIILANARQKIPSSVDIEIKTVDAVTRTKSGKTPLVMRLVD